MGAEILRKKHPVFSVLVLLPGREAAQLLFVLLLELLGLQLVRLRNGSERNRLSLCLVLLKNRRHVFFRQREVDLLLVTPTIRELKPVKDPLGENQFEHVFGEFHTESIGYNCDTDCHCTSSGREP